MTLRVGPVLGTSAPTREYRAVKSRVARVMPWQSTPAMSALL